MVLTDDDELAEQAKHLTTTAKISHQWSFYHDKVGYNYRLPNLNASLGVAQMEQLPEYLNNKRKIADQYHKWGEEHETFFVKEQPNTKANYWLNTIIMKNKKQRDAFLERTNNRNIITRPVWTPMHKLPVYGRYQKAKLSNTEWLSDRLVNVPSSVVLN